jgi:hypothetical protein
MLAALSGSPLAPPSLPLPVAPATANGNGGAAPFLAALGTPSKGLAADMAMGGVGSFDFDFFGLTQDWFGGGAGGGDRSTGWSDGGLNWPTDGMSPYGGHL